MEQGPDELTEREDDQAEEIDDMSGKPMNAPDKQEKGDTRNDETVADHSNGGG